MTVSIDVLIKDWKASEGYLEVGVTAPFLDRSLGYYVHRMTGDLANRTWINNGQEASPEIRELLNKLVLDHPVLGKIASHYGINGDALKSAHCYDLILKRVSQDQKIQTIHKIRKYCDLNLYHSKFAYDRATIGESPVIAVSMQTDEVDRIVDDFATVGAYLEAKEVKNV